MALSFGQVKGAAQQAGFAGGDLTIAVAVAFAESDGDPNSINHNTNGSTDYGLWQINTVHPTVLAMGNWRDPNTNARMAMSVFKGSGWKAWSTYKNGSYRKFLAQAEKATGVPAGVGSPGAPAPSGGGNAVADSIGGFGSSVGTFVSFVTDPKMWLRVGIFIAGGLFSIIGLILVLKDTSAGQAAIGGAKRVAGTAAMLA